MFSAFVAKSVSAAGAVAGARKRHTKAAAARAARYGGLGMGRDPNRTLTSGDAPRARPKR